MALILLALFLAAPSSAAEPLPSDADLSNPAYLIDLANVHLKYNSVSRARPFLHKALELSKVRRVGSPRGTPMRHACILR